MSYVKDLLTGVAQLLNDAGVGVYKATGAYASTDRAIVFGDYPQQPNQCLVLNYTPAVLDVVSSEELGTLECHVRGAPGDSWDTVDTAAALRDALGGITQRAFGTANVIQLLHSNSVPLSQDDLKRATQAETFQVNLETPSTAYRPSRAY